MFFEKMRSEKEIKNLCLIAWESLRRNTEYRKEYRLINEGYFLDLDAIDVFCEKWKIPLHLNPDTDFKELIKPGEGETQNQALKRIEFLLMDRALETLKKVDYQNFSKAVDLACRAGAEAKIQNLYEIYRPHIKDKRYQKDFSEKDVFKSDDAAFTRFTDTPIQNKYLPIYVNLSKPKKQILGEIEKLLDYWLSDKAREFYDIKQEGKQRSHIKNLERAYEIYDLKSVENLSFKNISLKMNLSEQTVKRDYGKIKALIDAFAPQEKEEVKSGGVTPVPFEEVADYKIAKQYLQDHMKDFNSDK